MAIQLPIKALLWALAIACGVSFGLMMLMAGLISREAARPRPPTPMGQTTAAAQVPKTEAPAKVADAPAKVTDDPERARVAEAKRLANKWTYHVEEDPMSSGKWRYATIQSENTVNFGFPYAGEQHGTLTLRDHPTHGRDVIFTIERGQLLCRSYEDCTIRLRFDEGSPERWSAVGPADNRSTALFVRGEARFVQKLRTAKVVRIQVRAFQQGEPIFEFHVRGFDHARYKAGN